MCLVRGSEVAHLCSQSTHIAKANHNMVKFVKALGPICRWTIITPCPRQIFWAEFMGSSHVMRGYRCCRMTTKYLSRYPRVTDSTLMGLGTCCSAVMILDL